MARFRTVWEVQRRRVKDDPRFQEPRRVTPRFLPQTAGRMEYLTTVGNRREEQVGGRLGNSDVEASSLLFGNRPLAAHSRAGFLVLRGGVVLLSLREQEWGAAGA